MNVLKQKKVTEISGVGAAKYSHLEQLGINNIWDLITYFPFRYEDYKETSIVEAEDGSRITIVGKVQGIPSVRWYGKKKSRLAVSLSYDGMFIQVSWFNQSFLRDKLKDGSEIAISGKFDKKRLSIVADKTFLTEEQRQKYLGKLDPIYSVSSYITTSFLRKIIYNGLKTHASKIEEILPQELIEKYKLIDRLKAINLLHFPQNYKDYYHARRRMAYEELLIYELNILGLKRYNSGNSKGLKHKFSSDIVDEFIDKLPFNLTGGQIDSLSDTLDDMKSDRQMMRLLQGDVGSGKTVVAVIALFANFLSDFQGVLMVPTEILAEQHYLSLSSLFESYNIKVGLLTGSLTEKNKKVLYEKINSHEIDIVVGTHALIQDKVTYSKLGLVIIDEQHRFGVKQRKTLRDKGLNPDVLFMTATPIPRTLAITVFGEMDVSSIKELPVGRKPIKTYWAKKESWSKIVKYIHDECSKGRQAYVICPLIEESEKLDLQNAQDIYIELSDSLVPHKVGLLHGKMAPKEKEQVMIQFSKNDLQVLVSTTVVEVGVNIPNATVMAIYDADRFGLAQLHQLRGRVGRGEHASTCILVSNPKSQIAKERIKVMTETVDGFEISKRDLEIRGPGDFLGTKQSGLPDFKVADIKEDYKILEVARDDAIDLLERIEYYPELKNNIEESIGKLSSLD